MKTYYHQHPRGFANECNTYAATTPAERVWAEEQEGWEQIKCADLRRHESWMRGEGQAFGRGSAQDPLPVALEMAALAVQS